MEIWIYFKEPKNYGTEITDSLSSADVTEIIMIVALNDIIAFLNLDLTFGNPCANWSLKAWLCNNLSHRNKKSSITQPSSPSELPSPVSNGQPLSLILHEKAVHPTPRPETMESFNHRRITKAKLKKPTGHARGTMGMQCLIGRIEPMAAALFEHKDTLSGVQCFHLRAGKNLDR